LEKTRAGIKAKNSLDELCRQHDLKYLDKSDEVRKEADRVLEDESRAIFKDKSKKLSERSIAYLTNKVMQIKRKLSGGSIHNKRKKRKNKRKSSSKKNVIKNPSFGGFISVLRKKFKKFRKSKKLKGNSSPEEETLKAAKRILKTTKKYSNLKIPRVIQIPQSSNKVGGVLGIFPILAGISALGAIGSKISDIYKNVKQVQKGIHDSEENKRHNRALEKIAITGTGFFLAPFNKNKNNNKKIGYGLYHNMGF
jgi:hypothetical protein